jgi:hypothetical protein
MHYFHIDELPFKVLSKFSSTRYHGLNIVTTLIKYHLPPVGITIQNIR